MKQYTVSPSHAASFALSRPNGDKIAYVYHDQARYIADELNNLLAQRDALLKALGRAEGWLNEPDVTYLICQDKGEQADYCRMMVEIRAAIKEAEA